MYTGSRRRGILILAALMVIGWNASALTQDKPSKSIKEGVLDEIKLYVDTLPAATRVVMKPFSASDQDVSGDSDDTKKMRTDAPNLLATTFAMKLKELGPFTEVTTGADAPAGALLVDGKFTEIDPGSRAKRYFVGFGAGKSGVTVVGNVKRADGSLLATFEQRRVGVMGVAGGNSMDKLTHDTRDIGEDIAKFLSVWAKGQKLN